MKSTEEGRIFWISRSDLSKYKLASGFADTIRVFEESQFTEYYHVRSAGNDIDELK